MTTKPKDDIFPIAEEPLAVRGAPTLAAAGEGTHLLAWEDRRGGNVDVYARLVRQEVVVNTSIAYSYDPLYRLTTAAYSGHISADYRYTYDEAGNMTAYTEQVNGQTTSVSRTFNAANQLVSSSDEELGKSSFSYDQNGNLEMTLLADDTRLGYRYDQRNLLEHAFRQAGPHGPEIMQAEFVYDGNANRVQQIDYSGGQPVTITYTNDILGMTQVLLADDGTTTTANLFGLDLISQDDGTQTRFLLTDGLGSVRQELAGGDLQTTTAYEPYGNLLTQTGTSGTTYGFTGEQEDAATGLVYLRARYYNPSLQMFMGRDPWRGNETRPQSLNGWNYVGGNPVNFVDPTGLRRCTLEEAARDFETCDQNRPLTDSSNLFNYNVIPGSANGRTFAYLQVNYHTLPWQEYAKPQAPHYPILIPVRHPLNLDEENPSCSASIEDAVAYYTGGGFTDWEINARNILAELHGVISSQQEWALRDAIGVAYSPYNPIYYPYLPKGE